MAPGELMGDDSGDGIVRPHCLNQEPGAGQVAGGAAAHLVLMKIKNCYSILFMKVKKKDAVKKLLFKDHIL